MHTIKYLTPNVSPFQRKFIFKSQANSLFLTHNTNEFTSTFDKTEVKFSFFLPINNVNKILYGFIIRVFRVLGGLEMMRMRVLHYFLGNPAALYCRYDDILFYLHLFWPSVPIQVILAMV